MFTKQQIGSAAAVCALLVAGCHGEPPQAQAQAKAPAPAKPPQQQQAAAPADACRPAQQLANLDHRKPVPLQPMMAWHQKQNMMEHLVAIQRITGSLARDDWQGVASASALIESSPQMQQMCQHMGAGAEGFTEMALRFHRRADAIGQAARAHDAAAVLRATSDTLAVCTECHAAFRQELVDAATFEARTGRAHDPATMHGAH